MADFIAITETEMPEFRKVTQLSNGDQSYSAIIQAAVRSTSTPRTTLATM